MRIATGEETEVLTVKSAAELGSLGWKARAKKLSTQQRIEVA
jgi:hypothetical protein